MADPVRLALVRAIHTLIYVVMASSVFAVLYAGVSGAHGLWVWGALALVVVEVIVLAGSGMKCPLTAIATKYGAKHATTRSFRKRSRATRLRSSAR